MPIDKTHLYTKYVQRTTILGMLMVSLLTIGCHSFEATVPEGFAAYGGRSTFRAVSPDGTLFRVRTERNRPAADLDFWKEALKHRMVGAGYQFVHDGEIEAQGSTGYLLELSAPLGNQDYSYLIALFHADKKLVIVESAGDVFPFSKRREAILQAIGQLQIRQ